MTAELASPLAISRVLIRKGVVAMPTRENYAEGDDWFLLKDTGANRGKREWVPGLTLLPWLYPADGDEFPGGAVKPADYPDNDRQYFHEAKQNALVREIREESGVSESKGNLFLYPREFFTLQLRPDKESKKMILTLFMVSVFHWVISDEIQSWLLEKKGARILTGKQIVDGKFGGRVRHRDKYVLWQYTREQILGDM